MKLKPLHCIFAACGGVEKLNVEKLKSVGVMDQTSI